MARGLNGFNIDDPNLFAIGETGLDRLKGPAIDLQIESFRSCWQLAESHHLCLIVHNVRASDLFMAEMKKNPPKTPWLFHDFRGSLNEVVQFLKLHPECFFSFGRSLFTSKKIQKLILDIPIGHIVLETDDSDYLIEDVNLQYALIKNMTIEEVKAHIFENVILLYPKLKNHFLSKTK